MDNKELFDLKRKHHMQAKNYFDVQMHVLCKGSPERIQFLFDDTIITSKRFERFTQKHIKKMYEYLKQLIPRTYDTFENSILGYILNTIDVRGCNGAFAFNHAYAETEEGRTALAQYIEPATGISLETFDFVDEDKTYTFTSHIKNHTRKLIKNTLVSKVLFNEELCESNYSICTEFSEYDYYEIISNVLTNAAEYIVFHSEGNVTPCDLDYTGLETHLHAYIDELTNDMKNLYQSHNILAKKLADTERQLKQYNPVKTTVNTVNPELTKENKALKTEIEQLKGKIKELEAIISTPENIHMQDNISRDVTQDKILFVGGHDNELQKLKYIFPNSTSLSKCSMDIRATQLCEVDYIVFLTHYMSHSLYHKVKGLADTHNIPYMHCKCNNPTLITENIAKQFKTKPEIKEHVSE